MIARPPSSSNFYVNLAGGLSFMAAIMAARFFFPGMDTLYLALASIAAAIVPVIGAEIFFLKVHKRPRVGWHDKPHPPDRERVRTKLVGYYAALILAGLCYQLIPEYDNPFYAAFRIFFLLTFIPAVVLGWLYIDEADRRLAEPHDNLWHFGRMLCGYWRGSDKKAAFHFLKSAVLRIYFIPVMFTYMTKFIDLIMQQDPMDAAQALAGINHIVDVPGSALLSALLVAYLVFAAIDVLFATIGYLFALRALDTDIRSVEPTILGWVVCIFCYFPFWETIAVQIAFRDFYNNPAWYEWLSGNAVFLLCWGMLAVGAMIAESLTTLCFGLRFSNLTYRGLISAGPFRFTKHPQYVSKLANRFLFYVPFLSHGGIGGALWTCFLFGGICAVYYLRARTEENHLSRYPEYVDYARWIEENGIFRFAKRIHPCFSFNEDRARGGRLLPAGPV